jgi:hypothetical protein
VIPHLHKHFLHVSKAKLFISRPDVLPERMKLARGNPIALDQILFRKVRTKVLKKAARPRVVVL